MINLIFIVVSVFACANLMFYIFLNMQLANYC